MVAAGAQKYKTFLNRSLLEKLKRNFTDSGCKLNK